MAYATYKEFQLAIGADKVSQMVRGSESGRQAEVESWLSAASGEFEEAASLGGYPTPIVGANLSSDAGVAANIDARVNRCVIALATGESLQPNDVTQTWKDARAKCEAWLERIGEGKGFPTDEAGASTPALFVVPAPGHVDISPLATRFGRRLCL